MSDTEHDSFSSEMVNQDRNTVFTHTTLSHTVHTSQGHILPLSGVTCGGVAGLEGERPAVRVDGGAVREAELHRQQELEAVRSAHD